MKIITNIELHILPPIDNPLDDSGWIAFDYFLLKYEDDTVLVFVEDVIFKFEQVRRVVAWTSTTLKLFLKDNSLVLIRTELNEDEELEVYFFSKT